MMECLHVFASVNLIDLSPQAIVLYESVNFMMVCSHVTLMRIRA